MVRVYVYKMATEFWIQDKWMFQLIDLNENARAHPMINEVEISCFYLNDFFYEWRINFAMLFEEVVIDSSKDLLLEWKMGNLTTNTSGIFCTLGNYKVLLSYVSRLPRKKVGYDEPMSSSVKVSYATYGQIKSHLYLLLKMYIYFCGFGEYIAIANPSNFNIPFESLRGIINWLLTGCVGNEYWRKKFSW